MRNVNTRKAACGGQALQGGAGGGAGVRSVGSELQAYKL